MARLLLINPNTSTHITDLVVAAARTVAAPGTEVYGATGRFGARYIMTRAASAVAAHAALDAYAACGARADAVVLACFGDPGLAALKEVAPQPVVGLAEASCLLAASVGRRFGIVTGGASWRPMLEEFVAGMGLSQRLAGIATVDKSGAEIAAEPAAAIRALQSAVQHCASQQGADVVILGGAGLAGLAGKVGPHVPVPVIDCVAAAIALAEARLKLGTGTPTTHTPTGGIATMGLSAELTKLLGGEE